MKNKHPSEANEREPQEKASFGPVADRLLGVQARFRAQHDSLQRLIALHVFTYFSFHGILASNPRLTISL
jgi:hypothetical protein